MGNKRTFDRRRTKKIIGETLECENCEGYGECEGQEYCVCSLTYEDTDIIDEWTIEDVKAGKLDVEKRLKELFPMINFEVLLNSTIPNIVGFNGRFISFEFYNEFENVIFYPYDKIDEKFNFLDWHFDCGEIE